MWTAWQPRNVRPRVSNYLFSGFIKESLCLTMPTHTHILSLSVFLLSFTLSLFISLRASLSFPWSTSCLFLSFFLSLSLFFTLSPFFLSFLSFSVSNFALSIVSNGCYRCLCYQQSISNTSCGNWCVCQCHDDVRSPVRYETLERNSNYDKELHPVWLESPVNWNCPRNRNCSRNNLDMRHLGRVKRLLRPILTL